MRGRALSPCSCCAPACSAVFRLVRSPDAPEISVGQVQRAHRIVREHAVLDHEVRDQPLSMADEQAVVAHAQAHDHVELAAGAVEQFGLRHRVAHRLEVSRPDFLLVLDADILLRHAAVLARDRGHLETVALEDRAEHAREIDEADAHGDTHFGKAHLLRELADLLHPRPFAVAFALDHRRDVRDAQRELVAIGLPGAGDTFGIDFGRAVGGAAFSPSPWRQARTVLGQ